MIPFNIIYSKIGSIIIKEGLIKVTFLIKIAFSINLIIVEAIKTEATAIALITLGF